MQRLESLVRHPVAIAGAVITTASAVVFIALVIAAFAGLFEFWRDKAKGNDAPWLASFSIVTTAARGAMEEIHDRQPVMLTRGEADAWLDPASSPDDLMAAIAAPAPELAWHEVGREVGNVRHQGAELIAPVSG